MKICGGSALQCTDDLHRVYSQPSLYECWIGAPVDPCNINIYKAGKMISE